MQQLGFIKLLTHLGINGAQRATIIGSIIARMAAPGLKLVAHRWLVQTSGLGELLAIDYQTLSLMMLTDLEAVFRSFKSELGLRPVFHHKEERADGYLFITGLGLPVRPNHTPLPERERHRPELEFHAPDYGRSMPRHGQLPARRRALDIGQRQKIMKLLVKEVIVVKDLITIKHSSLVQATPAVGNPKTSKSMQNL